MKKIIAIATLVAATSASAGFFNNGNGYNSSNNNNWGPFDGGSNFGPMNSGSNWGPFNGEGLKKSPIGQKLDFANHPYLCKGLIQ
jgi:hypothetical protein